MKSRIFDSCRQCAGEMVIVSPENKSPLVAECARCGNREYAEVQMAPPWPPSNEPTQGKPVRDVFTKPHHKKHFPAGMPVTVGDPNEEGTTIHFGCVVLGVGAVLLLIAVIWLFL